VVASGTPEALRSRVAGDVLTIEADEPERLSAEIQARFGLAARTGAHGVHVERERGHELVPRLVEAFPPGRFRSLAVRRPTLGDAFLAITGQDLERDEAPAAEEAAPGSPGRGRRPGARP
jgi:ABC-2 type transport system ATP-binding protein